MEVNEYVLLKKNSIQLILLKIKALCQRISPIGYNCLCPSNFTGPNCDIRIDPCASSPCSINGVCSQTSQGYVCQCLAGYVGIKYRKNYKNLILIKKKK